MAMAIFWPFSRDLKKVREGEGVGHEDVYGKDVPDRGNSECKGPEAGMSHSGWRAQGHLEGRSQRAGAKPMGPASLSTPNESGAWLGLWDGLWMRH